MKTASLIVLITTRANIGRLHSFNRELKKYKVAMLPAVNNALANAFCITRPSKAITL